MRKAIVHKTTRALLVLDTDEAPEGIECDALLLSDAEAAKISGDNSYKVDAFGVVTATPVVVAPTLEPLDTLLPDLRAMVKQYRDKRTTEPVTGKKP